jgi:branched-chain amino acid transport system substrate-binding protein
MAADEIRIGVMATLIGPYAGMGEDAVRGTDLAIAEFGGQIAGRKIVRIKESTNATPDSAVMAAEALLDAHQVDFIIGPLSGNEGLAIRDFAKTRPDRAFINGNAASQDMSLRDAAPNFFSFSTDGAQWMAGLAEYVYHEQGYRRVATLAEDYSYPHGQVGGFLLQFCRVGGTVVQKFWVALGTSNYQDIIASMPEDIDAIFVALAGTDAVNFLQQYDQFGGRLALIGGSTTIDQTVLNVRGALSERLVGMASAGPIADSNPDPEWRSFVNSYRLHFPRSLSSPSLFCYGYYVNTKGALLALHMLNGDLSDGQSHFMAALQTTEFHSPTGPIWLDHNRHAVANNFVTVVDKNDDGSLYNRLVRTIPNVNQTLGIPEAEYLAIGPFHRDNPRACF